MSPQEKVVGLYALESQLRLKGFSIINVAADGNCLFRSISLGLFGRQEDHKKIRLSVCDFISAHAEMFSPFLEGESVPRYASRMRRDGEWGGEPELQAASHIFRISFIIHQFMRDPLEINNPSTEGSSNIIQLYYIDRHYGVVVQRRFSSKESRVTWNASVRKAVLPQISAKHTVHPLLESVLSSKKATSRNLQGSIRLYNTTPRRATAIIRDGSGTTPVGCLLTLQFTDTGFGGRVQPLGYLSPSDAEAITAGIQESLTMLFSYSASATGWTEGVMYDVCKAAVLEIKSMLRRFLGDSLVPKTPRFSPDPQLQSQAWKFGEAWQTKRFQSWLQVETVVESSFLTAIADVENKASASHNLPLEDLRPLLSRHSWQMEDLTKEEVQSVTDATKLGHVGSAECIGCLGDEGDCGGLHLLECGHAMCADCWPQYINARIEGGDVNIRCPGGGCPRHVDEGTISWHLPCKTFFRLRSRQLDSVVTKRVGARFCPGTHCNRVAVYPIAAQAYPDLVARGLFAVSCGCGVRPWCLGCGERAHIPLTCDEAREFRYQALVNVDMFRSASTLVVFVKPCPHCGALIEKNGGCNYMWCSRCHGSFCYGCGKPFNDHRTCVKRDFTAIELRDHTSFNTIRASSALKYQRVHTACMRTAAVLRQRAGRSLSCTRRKSSGEEGRLNQRLNLAALLGDAAMLLSFYPLDKGTVRDARVEAQIELETALEKLMENLSSPIRKSVPFRSRMIPGDKPDFTFLQYNAFLRYLESDKHDCDAQYHEGVKSLERHLTQIAAAYIRFHYGACTEEGGNETVSHTWWTLLQVVRRHSGHKAVDQLYALYLRDHPYSRHPRKRLPRRCRDTPYLPSALTLAYFGSDTADAADCISEHTGSHVSSTESSLSSCGNTTDDGFVDVVADLPASSPHCSALSSTLSNVVVNRSTQDKESTEMIFSDRVGDVDALVDSIDSPLYVSPEDDPFAPTCSLCKSDSGQCWGTGRCFQLRFRSPTNVYRKSMVSSTDFWLDRPLQPLHVPKRYAFCDTYRQQRRKQCGPWKRDRRAARLEKEHARHCEEMSLQFNAP
eukprot:Rmarinus@m.7678